MPRNQPPPYRVPAATIGEFAVEQQLRRQPGVSTLYAARDLDGGGTVALQVLPFLANRPASHQGFLKATDLRDRLGCDGLVPAIAAGRAREGSWIALEPLNASTLRHLLSVEGPLSLPRSLAILRPVATALDAGRAYGLVCDSLTADTVLVSGEPGPDERGHLTILDPCGRPMSAPGGCSATRPALPRRKSAAPRRVPRATCTRSPRCSSAALPVHRRSTLRHGPACSAVISPRRRRT